MERIDRSDLMGIVELQGYAPCDQQIDRFVAHYRLKRSKNSLC
jgi:hypothetical protein